MFALKQGNYKNFIVSYAIVKLNFAATLCWNEA